MANLEKLIARAEPILERLPIDAPMTMAELGTYVGDLARYLLERRPMLRLHCVDPWRAAGHSHAYVATGDPHAALSAVEQNYYHSITVKRLARFDDRVTIHRMPSIDAAPTFADDSFDLTFVDGDHSFDGCLGDCRAWWPKVRSGGWLGGHDYGNADPRFKLGVDAAVQAFSAEVGHSFDLDGGMTYWFRKP